MAIYTVYVYAGNRTVLVDHASTIEMGAGGYTDTAARELAESYARTGLAQALREGYRDVSAEITRPDGYRAHMYESVGDTQ